MSLCDLGILSLAVPVVVFQLERARLAKEKQLREEAMRDKEELERKFAHLQEEVRLSHEALVSGDTLCTEWDVA